MGNGRPNILVFFTDQQRWDTCGCYGASPANLTPVLDRMAEGGTRLEYSFTVQPVCGPARAAFQTGRYPTQTGCYRNGIPLPEGENTLARIFGQAGYFTGYIGKWHLATSGTRPVPEESRGGYADLWLAADVLEFVSHPYDFRVFDSKGDLVTRPGYRVNAQTDLVLEALEDRAKKPGRPFFLFVSYLEPHFQNDWKHFVGPHGYAEKYRYTPVPPDLKGRKGDWAQELPDYYGAIRSLDENLGRVLEKLEETGLDRNTIVLFCSDHGCHFRTRNDEYKRSCHESSIRVPSVFAGPGFNRGTVVKELVCLTDWTATLVDAAGLAVPETMRGRSILPLLGGKAPDWPEDVFIQISESQVGRALRTKRWKYGVNAPGKNGWDESSSREYVEQYLYDLDSDPDEAVNLAGDPKLVRVADELAARLKRRMAAVGEETPEIRR